MTQPAITHVATSDIYDIMNTNTERPMALPGFDPEFVDFPHYIIRITEQIWHERRVELCLKYYAKDCIIHTLGGEITGAQTVVDNTKATMRAFPDRRMFADNVIWSLDQSDHTDQTYYSSHLITSKMTNLGESEFGPATGNAARFLTVADCLCRENQIIEEWLVRDNLGLVKQLGLDPDDVAHDQAMADIKNGFSLSDLHAPQRQALVRRDAPLVADTAQDRAQTPAAKVAIAALDQIWNKQIIADLSQLYDYRVNAHMPGAENLYGHDELGPYYRKTLDALSQIRLQVQHIAEIPYLCDAKDVAVRWAVHAVHNRDGAYGDVTQAAILIIGVTHVRVMGGRIREEWTVWDDIAVRRQIMHARLTA